MAKKKAKASPETAALILDRRMDEMFGSMIAKAADVLGRTDVAISAKCEELLVGLPLPALCLEYLLQMNILPLGRVIQMAGPEGSCKSALLYEIMGWHMAYGGGGALAENESKDAAAFRHSIWHRNPVFMKRCVVAPTQACEEWQRFLTKQVITAKDFMDEKGGIGRTIPMCFGVDSLTSTDVQKVIDQTMKDGAAAPGYALIAKMIACYMRSFTGQLRGYPFTVIATNHLKDGKDAQGLPIKNIPGGKAVPFMATFMFEMSRLGDIDKADEAGIRVKIKLAKNSLGPSRKFINAELLWWREVGPDGNLIQRHLWDWHTATIEMLLSFALQDGKKELYKAIQKVVDLRPGTGVKKRYLWSKTLGIPESDMQHFRVAGHMIQNRPDLLLPLYTLLGINRYPYFQPGIDYRDTLAAQKITNEAKQLVLTETDISKLPEIIPDVSGAEEAAAGDVTDAEPEFEGVSEEEAALDDAA